MLDRLVPQPEVQPLPAFSSMPATYTSPVTLSPVICTSRMNRIIGVDLANRRVEVESGVVNLRVTDAVKQAGFFYAPDGSTCRAVESARLCKAEPLRDGHWCRAIQTGTVSNRPEY